MESNLDFLFENIINENSDEKGTFDLESMQDHLIKAKSCICKIILDQGYGSGFFCRIPLGNKKELVNFLLTCHHVISKENLSLNKKIILEIGNKEEKELFVQNRRIFSNPELDYTCVEILDEDNIEDFYSIDDGSLKTNFSGEFYKDKHIINFAIMKNKRSGFSNGLIKAVKDSSFIYTCNTYPGSSGGAIVNQNTNCIIGIHLGEVNKENLKNSKIILNIGIFIRKVIDDINEKQEKQDKLSFTILHYAKGSSIVSYDSNIKIRDMLTDFLKNNGYYVTLEPNKYVFTLGSKILNSRRFLDKSLKEIIKDDCLIQMIEKQNLCYG